MSRFIFETATYEHEEGLRRLFAETDMEGDIQISFRREPNFFYATSLQGQFCQVIAGRDRSTREIIGAGTRAIRKGYINGKLRNVGYLADLRLNSRYRSGLLVGRAYRYLKRLHQDGLVELYFTLIAEKNRTALNTIASGRAGIPPYRDLGRIQTPAINLLKRKPPLTHGFEVVRGSADLLPGIIACLHRNHQRRQFAPHYAIDQFSAGLRGFNVEDFYVAVQKDRIIGVVGKWDQSSFKQTFVTAYQGKTRLLRPVYNFASALAGGPRYPLPGHPLRFFYASFIAIDDDDVAVFRGLLRELYNSHVSAGYDYFLIGLHESDSLIAVLKDFHLTPFSARLFAVHFADGTQLFQSLNGAPPYVEIAAL
jgi:hypothetical protein